MPLKKIACKKRTENQENTPCFQINPDVQLKDIPTTGEEYLLQVIQERQNCSDISESNEDYSKFAKNQSCFVEEERPALAPDILKPTKEWQNIQVADFSEVRMYISRMLAKKALWPSNFKRAQVDNYSSRDWRTLFSSEEPTLTCVLGLRHKLDNALECLVGILDEIQPGHTINHKTGQWIYAFLACVEQPILEDTCSIIRNLARKCAQIRSHLNPEDENVIEAVAPLNIFICLVSRYFIQHDLGDLFLERK